MIPITQLREKQFQNWGEEEPHSMVAECQINERMGWNPGKFIKRQPGQGQQQ
jgi:hypothetical protein